MKLSRSALTIIVCFLVCAPFLAVHFPPITDLPQQSAQIRLFIETIESPETSPYKIQWFTPYSLSYLILGGSWALMGPEYAGRLAMLIITLLWVISISLAAKSWNRDPVSAVIGSIFVLNHIIYWGFYSFAIGFPIFLVWANLIRATSRTEPNLKQALQYIGCVILLYMGHMLWLAAGLLWFGLRSVVFREPVALTLKRSLLVAPLVLISILWYQTFSLSSMATPTVWATPVLDRLTLDGLTLATLGGIRSPVEQVMVIFALVWVAIGFIRSRKDLDERVDKEALCAAAMFFAALLILPDKFMNTIQFWQRWGPAFIIMLVLSAPSPITRPTLRQAIALIAASVFFLQVASVWLQFETRELSGLKKTLNELPKNQRVMGLNMLGQSRLIHGRPFIQIFAYAQTLKSGRLNFSFAEFSPCLVVYKGPYIKPWTHGLEWFPLRLTREDLYHFDYVIVSGGSKVHRMMERLPELAPVTNEGFWRLYKSVAGSDAANSEPAVAR